MPSATTTTGPGATTGGLDDALDDLYDYDVPAEESVFRPFESTADAAAPAVPSTQAASRSAQQPAADLGVDEEITVKVRRKAPPLDEELLLSQKGIPKLRRIARDRLKLKGKGHEFADVARLLTLYQLWLDDLYPRAKFADGLAMIEKLGHSRRLQTMRREWIDEAKPRVGGGGGAEDEEHRDRTDGGGSDGAGARGRESGAGGERLDALAGQGEESRMQGEGSGEDRTSGTIAAPRARAEDVDEDMGLFVTDDEDDEFGEANGREGNDNGVGKEGGDADTPLDDDELDALLAEDAARGASEPGSAVRGANKGIETGGGGVQRAEDDFDDEMEAMAGLDFDY